MLHCTTFHQQPSPPIRYSRNCVQGTTWCLGLPEQKDSVEAGTSCSQIYSRCLPWRGLGKCYGSKERSGIDAMQRVAAYSGRLSFAAGVVRETRADRQRAAAVYRAKRYETAAIACEQI